MSAPHLLGTEGSGQSMSSLCISLVGVAIRVAGVPGAEGEETLSSSVWTVGTSCGVRHGDR
eukprot:3435699-Pyramimonas_sp.AAC.1